MNRPTHLAPVLMLICAGCASSPEPKQQAAQDKSQTVEQAAEQEEPAADDEEPDDEEPEEAASSTETGPEKAAPPAEPSAKPRKPTGTVSVATLSAVFKNGQDELVDCYEQTLKDDPKAKGLISVLVQIETDGKPSRVEIAQTTMNHRGMESCVRDTVLKWSFPKPRGGAVTVRKSFNFNPDTSGD